MFRDWFQVVHEWSTNRGCSGFEQEYKNSLFKISNDVVEPWVHNGSMEVDDQPRLQWTSHGTGHDISPPRDWDSTVFPAIANFWQLLIWVMFLLLLHFDLGHVSTSVTFYINLILQIIWFEGIWWKLCTHEKTPWHGYIYKLETILMSTTWNIT